MLLTVTPLENPGPPSPVPPPTPPKPRKDNAKLQRLLRKAAKKNAVQASPTLTTKSFRSTLSPVSEADLESIESAAPQKHKKPPSLNLPPRFQIKGVTHRVPSPYPKQKFTFTVSEQQSLSQYLSPSPVPDTPSPLPFRPSSPNILFLFPQGGNTPDRLTPRVIANSSPRPCTPKAVETPQIQPNVPQIQIVTPLDITVQETNGDNTGPLYPNKGDTLNRIEKDGFSSPKCEEKLSKVSSCSKSIPDKQENAHQLNGYCPSSGDGPVLPVSTTKTSEATDNRESVHDTSKVVDITQSADIRTSSVNHVLTTVSSIDKLDGEAKVSVKTVHVDITISPTTTGPTPSASNKELISKTEEITLLKLPEKPKPPRKKPGGGWARLVKHLVVEPEEPKFPEQQKSEGKTEKSAEGKKDIIVGAQESKSNRANKMWDALLYHMAASKEQEKPGAAAPQSLPFFRSRLPLLLHRPRFDARKLKEAASRPLRRVTAFFHKRVAEKETPSSFNRTASGWSIRGENDQQQDEKKAIDGDMNQ